MIGRIAAFLLLAGGGFAGLWWATGGSALAGRGEGLVLDADTDRTAPVPSVLIPGAAPEGEQDGDEFGTDVRFAYRGAFEDLGTYREVPLGDGSFRRLPIYKLSAADMEPRPLGRVLLHEVTVELFERDRDRPTESVHAGTLTADRADVVMQPNEDGTPSIDTGKDITLHRAVLVTTAAAQVKNARLELDEAIVRIDERAIDLRTVKDDQAFSLTIDDRGSMALSGLGLTARLPLDRGEQRPDPTDRLSIRVKSAADLRHRGRRGGVQLRSAGPMSYVEDPSFGTAMVTAAREVVLTDGGAPEPAAAGDQQQPDRGGFIATGDRVTARLRRGERVAGRVTGAWQRIELSGASDVPATLTIGGVRIRSQTLRGSPNLVGEPYAFTASGAPELDQVGDETGMRFACSDRVHVVQIHDYWQPWMGARGFGPRSFPAHVRLLMTFVGKTSVVVPRGDDTLQLEAEEGLWVMRPQTRQWPAVVRGKGAVAVRGAGAGPGAIDVSGTDGFLLYGDARGQHVRLGPEVADLEHRFSIRTPQLVAEGSGACSLRQSTDVDQPHQLRIHAPGNDAVVTLVEQDGELRNLQRLTATFDDGGIRDFEASGPDSALHWTDGEDVIVGHADRLVGAADGPIRLFGAPAKIDSERRGEVHGEALSVYRFGEDSIGLRADGAARALGSHRTSDGAVVRFDLTAEQALLLPFVVPTPLLAVHTWFLPPSAAAALSGLDQETLVATRAIDLELTRGEESPVRGDGDALRLRFTDDGADGALRGAPATITSRDHAGQRLTAIATVLQLARDGDGQVLRMPHDSARPPLLELGDRRGALARFGDPAGSTRLSCAGDITVAPAAISFGGSTAISAWLADGTPDEDGFTADARTLHIERNADGRVRRVVGEDVRDLRWNSVRARARHLDLDLATGTCQVYDPAGGVELTLPGRGWALCQWAEFNVDTYHARIRRGVVREELAGR